MEQATMKDTPSVLIVDDDISFARTMSLVLRHRGWEVVIAANGFEAIDRVRERTFDMIFTDIVMPVIDGVETFKHIKDISPDSRVVMMTGYAVEDRVEAALQEGAYTVVYKPLDMEKVVALVEERTR